jgi:peptidoglycan/LPS O-acetylase OafA/YrhL
MSNSLVRLVAARPYRPDVDGLRAIAVAAVIAFHFGWLRNGYLGVDVFFVVSGYLITGLVLAEMNQGRFSITDFYLRRIRRIVPLALLVTLVALLTGVLVMLPDDLKNLASSAVATNLFANNLLQIATAGDYWDLVNEYKPLMHTWSLGVEEQFYLTYPFLLLLLGRRPRLLMAALILLAGASVALHLWGWAPAAQRFYSLPYRLYELAIGGLVAAALNKRLVDHPWSPLALGLLILLLGSSVKMLPRSLLVPLTVTCTALVIASANERRRWSAMLENRILVGIGLISFGLYMWHQVVLAFARYFVFPELHLPQLLLVLALTIALSVLSYYLVERPFRDRRRVKTGQLLAASAAAFVIASGLGLYLYLHGGVIRDVPELDISVATESMRLNDDLRRSASWRPYNERVLNYDAGFKGDGRIRVLVAGKSFARDWANVLLESPYGSRIDLSFSPNLASRPEFQARLRAADVVFLENHTRSEVQALGIEAKELWIVSPKSFGETIGIFYNYRGADYYDQRAPVKPAFLERNELLRQQWNGHYLDYFSKVIDGRRTVPVFTPARKFISPDGLHLTERGAQYFAGLFAADLARILDRQSPAAQ